MAHVGDHAPESIGVNFKRGQLPFVGNQCVDITHSTQAAENRDASNCCQYNGVVRVLQCAVNHQNISGMDTKHVWFSADFNVERGKRIVPEVVEVERWFGVILCW